MWYIKLLSITCKLILIFVAAMSIVVVGVAIVELVVGAVFVVFVCRWYAVLDCYLC